MTKRTIRNWFLLSILYFIVLISIGIYLANIDASENRKVFSTFKDLIPLLLAIPVSWLGFCIQKRHAFMQQLRSIWSKLVDSVQASIQYTKFASPTEIEYSTTLYKMSVSIDEIRGVFKNIQESQKTNGLYPFEPLKDIYIIIRDISFGSSFKSENAQKACEQIQALWKDARTEILKEFDREVPTFTHSHWAEQEKRHIYQDHKIPRIPS